jgi:photosystem II stability/assembly factor-like uncharacterized protein
VSLKPLWLILPALCIATAVARGQYVFVRNFPSDTFSPDGGSGCHGLVVDPEGKIWIQCYGPTETIYDSAARTERPTRALYVYHPDGTPASFSPIRVISVGGIPDTLYNPGRGLAKDANGDILASFHDVLYRVDHRTGSGKNKLRPHPFQQIAASTSDTAGHLFVSPLVPGTGSIDIVSSTTFEIIGTVVDTTRSYCRALAVSEDGATLWFPAYPEHCAYVYKEETVGGGTYLLRDTVLKGMDIESITLHPRTKNLWVSAGSGYDLPNRYPGEETHFASNTWYEYDRGTGKVLDSVRWANLKDPIIERPGAIAFSMTGDTVYLGNFTSPNYPCVQMFVLESRNFAPTVGEYTTDPSTVLLLHFDDAVEDTTLDSSGKGHNGLSTQTTVSQGRFGLSRKFWVRHPGMISVQHSPELNVTPTLTLEGWVKPEVFSMRNTIIEKRGSPQTGGYALAFEANGTVLTFSINSDSLSAVRAPIDPKKLLNGAWHHVAGTYDGLSARILLDGTVIGDSMFARPLRTFSTDPVLIGNSKDGSGPFYGFIDEVRVSNSVRKVTDFTIPSPPENINASVVGGRLYCSWRPSAGRVHPKSYRLFASSSAGGPYSLVDSSLFHEYTGVAGKYNYYHIRAVDSAGEAGPASLLVYAPPDTAPVRFDLQTLVGSFRVFSARGPRWLRPVTTFNLSGGNWYENGGRGTFLRLEGYSGGSPREGILAFPSDSGGLIRATVGEYGVERPDRLALLFGLGDQPPTSTARVRFVIQVVDSFETHTLLDSTLGNTSGWRMFVADLQYWKDTRVMIRCITDPQGSTDGDLAIWALPRVTSWGPLPARGETEPNNSIASANLIGIGDSVDAVLNPGGDEDYYCLSTGPKDTVSLVTYLPFGGSSNRRVSILDTTGSILASMVGSVTITFFPPAPGRYYLLCTYDRLPPSPGETGRYRLAVRRFEPSAPSINLVRFHSIFHDTTLVDIEIDPHGLPTTAELFWSSATTAGISFTAPVPKVHGTCMVRIPVFGLTAGTRYVLQAGARNLRGEASPISREQEIPASPSEWQRGPSGIDRDLWSVAFADTAVGLVAGDSILLLTRDGGRSWTTMPPGSPTNITAITFASPSTAVAATADKRIFRSSTGGLTWSEQGSSRVYAIRAVSFADSLYGLAVGDSAAILATSDGGISWDRYPLPDFRMLYAVALSGRERAFAVGLPRSGSRCVTRSTNGGRAWWPPLSLPGYEAEGFTIDANSVTVWGTDIRAWSSDGGESWSWQRALGGFVFSGACLDREGAGLAVGSPGKILKTNNSGRTTELMSSGTLNSLNDVAMAGPRHAVVVGAAGTILRLEGSLTGFRTSDESLPVTDILHQNYPNPFNSITTFGFQIAKFGSVKLAIYDILGREVTILVNDQRPPGNYTIPFEASSLASGVYLYRLITETLMHTHKMVVIR